MPHPESAARWPARLIPFLLSVLSLMACATSAPPGLLTPIAPAPEPGTTPTPRAESAAPGAVQVTLEPEPAEPEGLFWAAGAAGCGSFQVDRSENQLRFRTAYLTTEPTDAGFRITGVAGGGQDYAFSLICDEEVEILSVTSEVVTSNRGRWFRDRDACVAAFNAEEPAFELGQCDPLRGLPEAPARDRLLEVMQRNGRVFRINGGQCDPWRFEADDEDPRTGSFRHTITAGSHRSVTTYGYRYGANGRYMALLGPWGEDFENGTLQSANGFLGADTGMVNHEADHVDVHGELWFFNRARCRRAARSGEAE